MVNPITLCCIATVCMVGARASTPMGCGKALPSGQSVGNVSNVTIYSGGIERSYLVFIPPTYNANIPSPIIFSYHGGHNNAEDQLLLDNLTSPCFNLDDFVVYPQGIDDTWQGVPGVMTNDVQFTTDILDQVQSLYCLDPVRIFATGKSDGGGFVNVLACNANLSRQIAAFAPVSGAYYVDTLPCYPSNVSIPCANGRSNIPILAFHGGNDTTIPYTGRQQKQACLPTIPHFIQEWAARDSLGPNNITTPVANDTVRYSFGNGATSGLVELVYDSVNGHDWPSTQPNLDNKRKGQHPTSFNATPMILEYFDNHPLDVDGTEHREYHQDL